MESPLLSRLFAVFLLCIPAVRIAEADRLWGAGFPQNEKASDRYEARIPLKGPGGATFTAYMARRCVEPDSTGSCDDSDMHDAPIWIVRDTDKAVVFSDAFYSDYGAPTRVVADADADGIPDLVISSTSGGSWASRTSVLAVLKWPAGCRVRVGIGTQLLARPVRL